MSYFTKDGNLVFCNIAEGVLLELGFPEKCKEWRERKLRKYSQFSWNICAELKIPLRKEQSRKR